MKGVSLLQLLSVLFGFFPSKNNAFAMAETPATSTTCSNKKFTAIVIGAGPSGLAMCLGLSSLERCERVHLVEKHTTFDARGANFILACNGLRALEEMSPGIQKDFEQVGVLADFLPQYPTILLPWWEMRDVLLARVRQQEKVTFHMGKRLNEIENNNNNADGVVVHFENDDNALSGDFLIGADGVSSIVRTQLNLPPADGFGIRTIIRGHANNVQDIETLAPLLDRGLVALSGNYGIEGLVGSVFNYNSKLRGKLAWVVGSKEDLDVEEEGATAGATALSILDPAKSTLDDKSDLHMYRALIENTEPENVHVFPQGRVVNFSQDVLDTYNGRWGGKNRVTLIGDAAHGFPSADGQGGSQAFEDACVLTRLLLQDDGAVQDTLAAYESQRLPRVKRIHDDQTKRFAAHMSGKPREPWPKEMMEWVFESEF